MCNAHDGDSLGTAWLCYNYLITVQNVFSSALLNTISANCSRAQCVNSFIPNVVYCHSVFSMQHDKTNSCSLLISQTGFYDPSGNEYQAVK